MSRTQFAGLTSLEPEDSVYDDNASFLWRNPQIIDALLKVGAQTHRHDAHPATPNPSLAPVVTMSPYGGFLPSGQTFWFGYTVLDPNGGETLVSPLASATTADTFAGPTLAPSAAVGSGGGLPGGQYVYAAARMDDMGGETPPGPGVLVGVAAPSKVTLSQLDLVRGTADHLAIYRSTAGGEYFFIGLAYGNTFVDDGTACADCNRTPLVATSVLSTASIAISIPTPLPSGATRVRVYASQERELISPALLYDLTTDGAASGLVLATTVYQSGSPPTVSLAKPGANQIDPDTELIDWHWKRPAASSGVLPAGAPGDVRLTLDDHNLWTTGSGSAAGPAGWTRLNLYGPLGPVGPQGPSGAVGPVGSAGLGLQARDIVTFASSGALSSGASLASGVLLGRGVRVMRVAPSNAARVRLYGTAAHRDADAGRPVGTDPTGDHGLMLEVITTLGIPAITMAPEAHVANMDGTASNIIYYNITNMAAAGVVSVDVTRQLVETI